MPISRKRFDYEKDPGPTDADHLKCNVCGYESRYDRNRPYSLQSECPNSDGGQMMSWNWNGWKDNSLRRDRQKEQAEKRNRKAGEPVSQETEDFAAFSEAERNIHGLLVVKGPGTEAPWLSGAGACLVKIYGIRRREGRVEFGIGNEHPPILGWVQARDFYREWPD